MENNLKIVKDNINKIKDVVENNDSSIKQYIKKIEENINKIKDNMKNNDVSTKLYIKNNIKKRRKY